MRRSCLLPSLLYAIIAAAVISIASAADDSNSPPAFLSSTTPTKTLFQTPKDFHKLLRNNKLVRRRLEDEEEDEDEEDEEEEEQEQNDMAAYSLQYGKCLRVKVPEVYDDDQAEGAQNYYNGKYYSQYYRYVSFFMCDSNNGCYNDNSCDYSTEYVVDMETYLQATVEFTNGYCYSCANQCRRRKLDDGDNNNGGNYYVDCNTCKNECKNYGDGGTDETNYLECQEAYEDDNGVQLYSAPACDGDGYLFIGLFYDEDCTIKTNAEYEIGFTYGTFRTIEGMCLNCGASQDEDTCGDMFDDAMKCKDGKNANGDDDDDMKVCKAFKSAAKEWQYSSGKKSFHIIPFIILVVLLCGCCCSYSYGYYIRHRDFKEMNESSKSTTEGEHNNAASSPSPLASQDYDVTDKADNLPKVT